MANYLAHCLSVFWKASSILFCFKVSSHCGLFYQYKSPIRTTSLRKSLRYHVHPSTTPYRHCVVRVRLGGRRDVERDINAYHTLRRLARQLHWLCHCCQYGSSFAIADRDSRHTILDCSWAAFHTARPGNNSDTHAYNANSAIQSDVWTVDHRRIC